MISVTVLALEGAGRRSRARNLLLGALLGLVPASASACMPDFHEHEAPVRVEGKWGAVSWQYGIWEETKLGPAEDLGGGFVLQHTLEGDWCSGEASLIVQDCASGEAVSVGGEFDRMIVETYAIEAEFEALVRARARAGQPMPIAEISAEAQARGMEFVVPMRTGSRFRMGGFEFQLGEACRIFYPGLSGNGEESRLD